MVNKNDYLVDFCGDEGVFFDSSRKTLDKFYNCVFGAEESDADLVLSSGKLFYCSPRMTEDITNVYKDVIKYL